MYTALHVIYSCAAWQDLVMEMSLELIRDMKTEDPPGIAVEDVANELRATRSEMMNEVTNLVAPIRRAAVAGGFSRTVSAVMLGNNGFSRASSEIGAGNRGIARVSSGTYSGAVGLAQPGFVANGVPSVSIVNGVKAPDSIYQIDQNEAEEDECTGAADASQFAAKIELEVQALEQKMDQLVVK